MGGGPAGIAAAIAAARNGATTILIERYGFLGGGGTIYGSSSFDGLHANVYGEIRRVRGSQSTTSDPMPCKPHSMIIQGSARSLSIVIGRLRMRLPVAW